MAKRGKSQNNKKNYSNVCMTIAVLFILFLIIAYFLTMKEDYGKDECKRDGKKFHKQNLFTSLIYGYRKDCYKIDGGFCCN